MKERIPKIRAYLEKYYQYGKGKQVIDYYKIFDLSSEMSIEELTSKIKSARLSVLFHPDSVSFLPDDIRIDDYMKMIDIVCEMINVFGSNENKQRYDRKLTKFKLNQSKEKIQKQGYHRQNGSDPIISFYDEEKYQYAVVHNILKYGFDYTKKALSDFLKENYINGFTRDYSVRDVIQDLGRDKIINILRKHYQNKNIKLDENLENAIIHSFSYLYLHDPKISEVIHTYCDACYQTIYKYDSLFDHDQASYAVFQLISNKDFSSFTNQGGARSSLKSCVKKNDGKIIPTIYLIANDKYSYFQLKNMSDMDLSDRFISFLRNDSKFYQESKKGRRF